jgi:hypothetical protein
MTMSNTKKIGEKTEFIDTFLNELIQEEKDFKDGLDKDSVALLSAELGQKGK